MDYGIKKTNFETLFEQQKILLLCHVYFLSGKTVHISLNVIYSYGFLDFGFEYKHSRGQIFCTYILRLYIAIFSVQDASNLLKRRLSCRFAFLC